MNMLDRNHDREHFNNLMKMLVTSAKNAQAEKEQVLKYRERIRGLDKKYASILKEDPHQKREMVAVLLRGMHISIEGYKRHMDSVQWIKQKIQEAVRVETLTERVTTFKQLEVVNDV